MAAATRNRLQLLMKESVTITCVIPDIWCPMGPNLRENPPASGHWFHEQFIMLVKNAYPPLEESPDK